MALPFPLIPVLIGAAAGAAVTYILTSRSARKQITQALQDLEGSAETGAEELKAAASDKLDEAADAVKKAASKLDD